MSFVIVLYLEGGGRHIIVILLDFTIQFATQLD